MRSAPIRCALVALLAAVVLAPSAVASPASDSAAVVKDYSRDRDVTSCRFAVSQLRNTLAELAADADVYASGFRSEVNRELKRAKQGGCKGKRSVDVRIVKVQSKGEAGVESITLKNTGRKTVNLRRFMLRDSADHVIRFTKVKLEQGRSLRVATGCRSGHKKAVLRGSRYYACRTKQLWDDGGDVVELVTPQGGLLSRRAYGTAPT